ncbi:glycosyltransferase family A protein [Williamsia sp.]|uniref:glycosyltransferase family 2 protein n=1 Tax=Williamsia sp. TaxID=1872085 RepID=UPI002F95CE7C
MTNSPTPLVTVLVPAYNVGEHVDEALETILRQDFSDFELLVVDDGSTDNTSERLAAVNDPRLRVIRQQNTGLVGALNTGLDHARGTYIARMDADDLMPQGRLSAQVAAMNADPGLVACGTDYEMFGAMTGRVRMPAGDKACRQRLLLATCHCGASLMIRRAVLERAGIRFRPEYAHAEDYQAIVELSEHGRLRNLPIMGYSYRIHPSQVSSMHSQQQRNNHLRIAREHAAADNRRPLPDDVLAALLWPPRPTGPRPVAAARAFTSAVRPAVAAATRAPGLETFRFVGRKVYESTVSAALG